MELLPTWSWSLSKGVYVGRYLLENRTCRAGSREQGMFQAKSGWNEMILQKQKTTRDCARALMKQMELAIGHEA